MPAIPHDWNVVVNAAWNLAILSPDGIAKRLFGLDAGTPVEVHVALNQPGSIRVVHEGISVSPTVGRLTINPNNEFTIDKLAVAASLATAALRNLPETPLSAVGVNFRFKFEELPDRLIDFGKSGLDDQLADGQYMIAEKLLRRTIGWNAGIINLELLERQDVSGLVSFNFHRESANLAEQVTWLELVREMHEMALALLDLMEVRETQ